MRRPWLRLIDAKALGSAVAYLHLRQHALHVQTASTPHACACSLPGPQVGGLTNPELAAVFDEWNKVGPAAVGRPASPAGPARLKLMVWFAWQAALLNWQHAEHRVALHAPAG